jgi:hypothetical protein
MFLFLNRHELTRPLTKFIATYLSRILLNYILLHWEKNERKSDFKHLNNKFLRETKFN